MKEWSSVPLGDLLRRRSEWVTLDPDANYKQATVRLWGKGVALRGILKGAEIAASSQLVIRSGDFIMSRIDARHGAFGLVPPDMDGAVVSQDFPVFDVCEDRLLPGFLNWMSKTTSFVDLCKGASEGTTNRVRLKEDRFLNKSVRIPLVPEQRRIVAKLDAIAERVSMVDTLRTEIRADLSSLVVVSNRAYSRDRQTPLGEALSLDEDRTVIQPGVDYPQIGIKGFGGGLFAKAPVRAEGTTYKHFNRLHEGHFVVSQVKGWEGAVAVCSKQFAGLYSSPEYRTFRCNADLLRPSYLGYLCRTEWFHALLSTLTRGQGARRERLRPEMLLDAKLPLPKVTDQERLEAVFRRAETARDMAALGSLQSLIPSLLDRAFNSKANIKSCDIAVSENQEIRSSPQLENATLAVNG